MGNDDRPENDSLGKRFKDAVRSIRGDEEGALGDEEEQDGPIDPEVERAWAKVDTDIDGPSKSPASEPAAVSHDDPPHDTPTHHEETEPSEVEGESATTDPASTDDEEAKASTPTSNSVAATGSPEPDDEPEEPVTDEAETTDEEPETLDEESTDGTHTGQETSETTESEDGTESVVSDNETADRTSREYVEMLESRVETLEVELEQAETQLGETESQLEATERRLAETETELAETRDELESVEEEFAEFRSVEPELDDFQQSSVRIDQYVDTLEDYVENLNAELERKDSVIQELKDRESERVAEAQAEAVEKLAIRFTSEVRESLVRGIEQAGESMPKGVRLTLDQFDEVLADYDISVVAPTVGEQLGNQWDREQVEVTQVDHSSHEEGAIIDVSEHGLERDGTLIKKPQVKLSEGPPPDEESKDETTSTDEPDRADNATPDERDAESLTPANEENPQNGAASQTNVTEEPSDTDEDKTPSETHLENDDDSSESDGDTDAPSESAETRDEDDLGGHSAPEDPDRSTDRTVVPLQVSTNKEKYEVGDAVKVSVMDDDGCAVADAVVTIADDAKARTDAEGNASVPVSTLGEVRLTVQKAGDTKRKYLPVLQTIKVEDHS